MKTNALQNRSFSRASGILAPLFSLPGVRDVGSLGSPARAFVDFLADAGQTYYQTLPVNPIDESGSPYAGRSAFAGETLYLDLEDFREQGLLNDRDLDSAWFLPSYLDPSGSSRPQTDSRSERLNYADAFWRRSPLWEKAFDRYRRGLGGEKFRAEEERFRAESADWLDSYALFVALAEKFGAYDWSQWPSEFKRRDSAAVAKFAAENERSLEKIRFLQLAFDVQWREFRAYCAERGVRIFGDVPIYVGKASADVWSEPELFLVDSEGRTIREAGVPADDYNPDGQKWNSPLYDWPKHKATGFRWWKRRIDATLRRFDVVRLDHFIGFYNFYSFPGDGVDPVAGEIGAPPKALVGNTERVYEEGWLPGPREEFFEAIFEGRAKDAFVAEDLGVMNQGVVDLRDRFGLPGMKVLQFALGGGEQEVERAGDAESSDGENSDPFATWTENFVAYTGTHDGEPIMGWHDRELRENPEAFDEIERALSRFAKEGDAPAPTPDLFEPARQKSSDERGVSTAYRKLDPRAAKLHLAALRSVADSKCKLAIFPIQDVVGLSGDSRINFPGVAAGAWSWRLADGLLDESLKNALHPLTLEADRTAPRP